MTARNVAKNVKLDSSKFVPNMQESQVQRAAAFLDWAAKEFPYQFAGWNEVLKAIQGYGKLPPLKSDETVVLRGRSHSIKQALLNRFNRELVYAYGVGIRASVDHGDVLLNVMPKKATQLQSARRGFVATANSIDSKKVPNTPEYSAHKEWFTREVKDVMKQIASKEFEQKLLTPGKP